MVAMGTSSEVAMETAKKVSPKKGAGFAVKDATMLKMYFVTEDVQPSYD